MRPVNNPFNTSVIETIPFVFLDNNTDLKTIIAKLENNKFKGAFCGPKGSGKTVLMDEIQMEFQKKGFIVKKCVLYLEDSFFQKAKKIFKLSQDLSKKNAVFLDGAEQLGYTVWVISKWYISIKAKTFLITAHKPGRMPLIYQTTTCEKLLEKLLLNYPVDTMIDIRSIDLKKLFNKNNGNIREIFRSLYDIAGCIADK